MLSGISNAYHGRPYSIVAIAHSKDQVVKSNLLYNACGYCTNLRYHYGIELSAIKQYFRLSSHTHMAFDGLLVSKMSTLSDLPITISPQYRIKGHSIK